MKLHKEEFMERAMADLVVADMDEIPASEPGGVLPVDDFAREQVAAFVPKKRGRGMSVDWARIETLHKAGWTRKEIIEETKVGKSTLDRWLHQRQAKDDGAPKKQAKPKPRLDHVADVAPVPSVGRPAAPLIAQRVEEPAVVAMDTAYPAQYVGVHTYPECEGKSREELYRENVRLRDLVAKLEAEQDNGISPALKVAAKMTRAQLKVLIEELGRLGK